MQDPLRRLRERRLVQWGLAYLAGAWLLIQVTHVLAQQFNLPDALGRSVTALLGVGFLAALVVAWYHGEKGRQRVSGPELLMLSGIMVVAGVAVLMVRDEGVPAERGTPGPTPAVAAGLPPVPVSADESIAVLPFTNLSPDPENEFFADGLTEDLLTDLGRMTDLRVISRTTVMRYRGTGMSVREIGDELGVAHVVEGSVRRADDRVRVVAQLIDARTDEQLWAETYDRDLDDVFQIQRDIASRIAQSLQGALPGGAIASVSAPAPSTDDPGALLTFMEARHAFHNRARGPEELLRSVELYEEALARDPDFSRAWSGLASAWATLASSPGEMVASGVARARGEAAAARAIELDPGEGGAFAALGLMALNRARWGEAEEHLLRALDLDPNHVNAHLWYGILLVATGRSERAEEILLRSVDLDPGNAIAFHWLADAARNVGRLEASRAHAQRSVDLGIPSSGIGVYLYHLHRGDWERATASLEELATALGTDPGFAAPVVAAVRDPELVEIAASRLEEALPAGALAPESFHFDLDAPDLIFDGIEGFIERDQAAFGLWRMWEPQLRHLRNHPRFREIAERAGLLEYWEQGRWPDLCEPRGEAFVCR